MRLIGVLAIVLLSSVHADAQPDVRAILGKVSALYKSATQYEFVADSRGADPTSNENSGHARIAFKAPNQYRMDGRIPGSSADALGNTVIVCDGSTVWFYFPEANQYGSISVSALNAAGGDLRDGRPESVDNFAMSAYRQAERAAGAKYLRDEAIEFLGAKVDCYVLSLSPPDAGPSPHTWWIDKNTYRVLREDDSQASVVFTSVKLGEPLPDDLFRFVPPEGAVKIELQQ